MSIGEIARHEVVTVSPETTVAAVAATMVDEGVGSVVVAEPDGEPLGIVTDRDLALDVLGVGVDPEELTAAELMSERLFTVPADLPVFDVVVQMAEAGVRRVPVVDDGSLVGIVTLDDFVVLVAAVLADLATVIDVESPPWE